MSDRASLWIASVLVAVGLSGSGQPASGEERVWTGVTNYDWFTSSNWEPAGVPAESDQLSIFASGPRTSTPPHIVTQDGGSITFDGASAVGLLNGVSLHIGLGGGGPGRLDILNGADVGADSCFIAAGSQATVSGTGSTWDNSSLDIHTGTLNINSGGMVNTKMPNRVTLGFIEGTSGTATIDGNKSRWTINSALHVGVSGQGILNVTDGGFVSNTDAHIAENPGSSGQSTVSGTESKWQCRGVLYVGEGGTGVLLITDGAEVTNNACHIAENPDSSGEVTVSGDDSTWYCQALYVGNSGGGTLNINTRGEVWAGSRSEPSYLGRSSDSSGTVIVDGAESYCGITGILNIGHEGVGTFDLTHGGTVYVSELCIGSGDGGNGEVTVAGTGSTWTSDNGLSVGDKSDGKLSVIDGAILSSSKDNIIGHYLDSAGEMTVSGANTSWTHKYSAELVVGDQGNGKLNITAGAAVTSDTVYIGKQSGASGTVKVSGAGSTWTLDDTRHLHVGYLGKGLLEITNGAEVSNTYGEIGVESGADGTVTVSGAGSTWNNNSNLSIGQNGGVGTLNVFAGGAVFTKQSCRIFPSGQVIVSGAGATLTGNMGVTGTLSIGTGGTVSSVSGSVSGGETTVKGTWSNSGSLTVSDGGRLNISGGGHVTSSYGEIGTLGSSAPDQVTVNGGDWIDSGSLQVGRHTDGTLTMNAGDVQVGAELVVARSSGSTGTLTIGGGIVQVATELLIADKAGSTGTVNLKGGTLSVDTVRFGSGNATFNWTGGQLKATEYLGSLTNSGGTISPGHSPGRLIIRGDYEEAAPAASVHIEIGGREQGTQHDQMVVIEDATLMGSLIVELTDNFVPESGDTFTILRARSITGEWANTSMVPILGGGHFDVTYHHNAGTHDTVMLSNYVPGEPDPAVIVSLMKATGGGFEITFPPVAGRSHVVQYSDTLTEGSWRSLPGEPHNLGTVVDPAIGLRQRFYRVKLSR